MSEEQEKQREAGMARPAPGPIGGPGEGGRDVTRLEAIIQKMDRLTSEPNGILTELDAILARLEGPIPTEDSSCPEATTPTSEFERLEMYADYLEKAFSDIFQKVHKLSRLL